MKEFSSDEIVQLKRNPNTFNVNRFRLYLTKAAKEEVVRLREKNYSYTRIFEELGYDISIIGKGRARGAVDHIYPAVTRRVGTSSLLYKKQPSLTMAVLKLYI